MLTGALLAGSCAVGGAWLFFASRIDAMGRPAPPPAWRADAIVVPGCAVLETGTPGPALRRRTELAVTLWHEGRADTIIFTGGVSTHATPEARAAATLARELGVPDTAILVEDRSTSTWENAREATSRFGPRRVIVTTDRGHGLRCRWVFQAHAPRVAVVTTTSPSVWARAHMALREVPVLAAYALQGRLRTKPGATRHV